MKKSLTLLILILVAFTGLKAQIRSIKQVIELQMPGSKDDEFGGTRGASICWNPETKKYYAAFAGNKKYPMAVFNAAGNRLSESTLTCMEDIRGLWYEPASKSIMANGYNQTGWVTYQTDKNGIPTDCKIKFSEMNQPNKQSVGVYDSRLKHVLFLDKSRVMFYENFADMFARLDDSVQIHWGRKKTEGPGNYENEFDENEDYNLTSVISTGIKNAEFGFLKIIENQIELYDAEEGYLQQIIKLPSAAPVEAMFNFAFTNGIYWLFDMKNRKWIGYK